MKTIIRKTHLRDKFEGCIHLILCPLNRIRFFIPRKQMRRLAKRITSTSNERMPVCTGKSQMILHFFSLDHFIFVVPPECKWIVRLGTLILYLPDIFKIFFFDSCGLHIVKFYL